MTFPRGSGILLHPTSLPGRFGIGDLGREAYDLVDFLVSAGQSYWQVLPLSPTGYGDSPYQGLSAFAGNPLLISPAKLVTTGHLSEADLADGPSFPQNKVDFRSVTSYKSNLLEQAFTNFRMSAHEEQKADFASFCEKQANWLDDYALFIALKKKNQLRPWHEWDPDLAARKPEALGRARVALADEIQYEKYQQWQFFTQWLALKRYANQCGIEIIGDIPIFVALDSADVWANTDLFHLDEHLQPIVVSGVPPDYFSETGQLWGHPLYRWDVMEERGYAWWIDRFRMALTQADVVRVDHFRGFYNYWAVPAEEETAMNGEWRCAPAADLFYALTDDLGQVAIIAEDLGEFDEESRAAIDELQETFGYPGMKVLQFAFGGDPDDPFLPHNFCSDWVAYTGTHDNDTVVGWYETTSAPHERDYARQYMASDGSDIAWDFIQLAWASTADTAITTAQDLLSLGNEARMNMPGTVGPPNWRWRLQPGALNHAIAQRLHELTWTYGRKRPDVL